MTHPLAESLSIGYKACLARKGTGTGPAGIGIDTSRRWRTGIAVAEVDLGFIDVVRKRIPVWEHRRPDVYGG